MKPRVLVVARVAVGLAASLGLGWLVIRGLDWSLVRESLTRVSLPLFLLAVAVFMLASWLRAFRWQILFVNEQLSVSRLFIVQHEGLGLSNMMPIRIVSEVTQLAVLRFRDGVRAPTALATLGMERVIDVAASTMILAVAFFLVPEMKEFSLIVWGALGFTVVVVLLVRVFAWSSDGLAIVKRISFLATLTAAVRDLERERMRLLGSYIVSVAYWLLVGLTAWILATSMDVSISPMTATLVIMGTIFFVTAVPAAPSAIGTFEFAVVYMLGFFDIERSTAFGYAVIIHAVLFVPSTVIAAIFLPREGVLSLRRRGRRLAASQARAGDGQGS